MSLWLHVSSNLQIWLSGHVWATLTLKYDSLVTYGQYTVDFKNMTLFTSEHLLENMTYWSRVSNIDFKNLTLVTCEHWLGKIWLSGHLWATLTRRVWHSGHVWALTRKNDSVVTCEYWLDKYDSLVMCEHWLEKMTPWSRVSTDLTNTVWLSGHVWALTRKNYSVVTCEHWLDKYGMTLWSRVSTD